MRSTFRTLFYLKKGSPAKDGRLPLMCRVTIDGQSCSFSCKHFVCPEKWNRYKDAETSVIMESFRLSIDNSYFRQLRENGFATAMTIRDDVLGFTVKASTLLDSFVRHNDEILKKVGYGCSKSTYSRYAIVLKHLTKFVRGNGSVGDIPLCAVNESFVERFDLYLRKDAGCSANSVWGYMTAFKHVFKLYNSRLSVHNDPFAAYKCHYEQIERTRLTVTELRAMVEVRLKDSMDVLVRDLFVFAAFTGLSYIDVKCLTSDDIQHLFDNELWIVARRKKTGIQFKVRLLDIPIMLLRKYDRLGNRTVFPVPSNNCCNEHLRTVCKQCGISAPVTFHTARHTFATMALNAGMPVESVSRLLGHTNIRTTQLYAKLSDIKLGQDMAKFGASVSSYF